jgi:CRP-like cAMP-binding protein
MLMPVHSSAVSKIVERYRASSYAVTRVGQLDVLATLDQIGTRRCFNAGNEIYADGDLADCWYRVVSGTVRICKLLADGRRHIVQFCFAGDCFGLPPVGARIASAEAIDVVAVMRYPQRAADQLIDEKPRLARDLYARMLCELVNAHRRALLLGRMAASERVANFLVEISQRQDRCHIIDLAMTRSDIADYLGLTVETVCRELSAFKRDGIIATAGLRSDRIELRDHETLQALCEGALSHNDRAALRASHATEAIYS